MFRNYLKTAFRNLRKNKLYATINIFGLSVGLTACLLIGVYIHHELEYDRFHENAGRIVRATMEYSNAGTVNAVASTGTKVGPQFKRTFPSIEAYTRTFITHNVVKAGDKMFDEPRILYADDPFFKIFSFHIIEGDPATALDAPDKIVLTRSMAKKYFGNETALAKTISSGGKELRVSAICEDVPAESQLKFDFVTQFLNLGNGVKDETWWTANWITYLLLKDKNDIPKLQQQVTAYMKTPAVRTDAGLDAGSYLTYNLEPLTRVHLYSALAGFEPNGSITYIYLFAVIALLILIIAGANYTNLAIAQSAGRSAEIGIRKVIGATRKQVFLQFIGESSLVAFIAVLLAYSMAVLLIPAFNSITGKQFTAEVLTQPMAIAALLSSAILVSCFAGLYPAVVLSGTQVMGVLKTGFSFTGGNNALRKILIVAQFAISVFLIIYTMVILQQMPFYADENLGYNKDHVVVLPVGGNMMSSFENTKTAFRQVPGVEAVTASYETPEYVEWGDGITAIDERGKHDISLNAMPVDLDFTKTLQMKIIAGRDFQESDFGMMDTSGNYVNFKQPFIINETLAKKIGWQPGEAIGKIIQKNAAGPVVGVIADFNFSSLHDPIGPLVIFLGRNYSRNIMIRINGNNMQSTIAGLENTWKQRVPDRPFMYHFLDEDYNKLYLAEQRTSKLFTIAAGLAILLACMGLFGLAAFTSVQRTKEIGIRRILGANISSITFMMAKNFLVLVGIAILVAIPLAWWAGNHWLRDFAYRMTVQPFVFIGTAMITILIALCTVSFHAVKTALMNPVKSLKSE